MSRITSSIGLITGIPIEETVAKLLEVASRPRTILNNRNEGLKQTQLALDTLGSRLLSFQFAVDKLKAGSLFTTREVTSSKPELLAAALPTTGTPAVGAFQVRPVRAASAQQLVSQQFESGDDFTGAGELTLRFGGFVDQGVSLDQLNDGEGVQRGKIRVTDRTGVTAVIDLSFARTVDDVLDAINSNTDVAVTAAAVGDRFTLTDSSGGSGNLVVTEVAGGTTAADLGLAGINVAANTATGSDVFRLHTGVKLSTLNDGNGVRITAEGVVDLDVDLSDGTSLQIDLADAVTLGDVITQINAANPAKLSAAISGDGNRLVLTDLSGGAGTFSVANGAASSAAEDLGLVASSATSTITGGRLVSGLRDTLLTSLNGGAGLGDLGEIDITDRDGGADTVDLATAETLGDVVALINASTAEVTASINTARNGVRVADDSGGSGNLIVANGDATNTATKLGLVVNAAVSAANSGTLNRQTIGEATLLSSLNGGKGVTLGDIRVIDSDGVNKSADLNSPINEPQTVGDIIDAINGLTNGVEARINDTGDGVLVIDTADGDKLLTIQDISGNIAASLNLTRTSQTVDIEGEPTQVIDGTVTHSVDLTDLGDSEAAVTLDSLNGGNGVGAGYFIISDSFERSIAINLAGADADVTTVEQLIDRINQYAEDRPGGFSATARLNDAGTGIQLEDVGDGPETLTVREGNSSTAADLKLLKDATTTGDTQIINGAGLFSAAAATATGLDALVDRINALGAGVTASKVFDGVGYRLSILSDATGAANELLIDAGDSELVFEEASQAQDALLLYGNFNSPGAGLLLSSPDNNFPAAVGNVNLTVLSDSETPVTVTVSQTDAGLVEAVEDLVDSYNALRTDLGKLTAFDPEALTTGLLFGTNEALQIDQRMSRLLTDRYFGAGSFQTLTELGIAVAQDGTLELDKAKLQDAFENNPEGVEEFFTNPDVGVAKKISDAINRLAGAEDSLLANRSDALADTIEANQDRIDELTAALERQRERLTLQFVQLEQFVARMQTSLSALQNLQVLPPLSSTSS